MGSYISNAQARVGAGQERVSSSVTLGKMITHAKGGDLIILQDAAYLDNYNLVNRQEAHVIKHYLRFKGKDHPPHPPVQLWSRVCLVVDSEVADLKFLLEVTEQGFQQYEFLSRMLQLKKDPDTVIAYVQCAQPASDLARERLMQAARWLQGRTWKQIFANEDEQHKGLSELVQQSFLDTKDALNRFAIAKDDSWVRRQLHHVFGLFTQLAGQTDEQRLFAEQLHGIEEPLMQFEDIGNFLCFLAVNEHEREQKVAEIVADLEPLVKRMRQGQQATPIGVKGINFEALMRLLVQGDALNALQLTEKERLSVLSTQICKHLLLQSQFLTEFKEPGNRMAEDANDVYLRLEPFDLAFYDLPKILIRRASK